MRTKELYARFITGFVSHSWCLFWTVTISNGQTGFTSGLNLLFKRRNRRHDIHTTQSQIGTLLCAFSIMKKKTGIKSTPAGCIRERKVLIAVIANKAIPSLSYPVIEMFLTYSTGFRNRPNSVFKKFGSRFVALY